MLHRLLLGLMGLCCLAAAAAGAVAPADAARKVPPPFPMDDPCNTRIWTLQDVPWRKSSGQAVPLVGGSAVRSPAGTPARPFTPAACQAQLSKTMESVRVLYGPLTPAEQETFQTLWAPFFEHPTPAVFDYFLRFQPLIEEYLGRSGTLAGADAVYQECMEDLGLAVGFEDAAGARAAMDTASLQFRAMEEQQRQLDSVLARIRELGDPPNPMEDKCQARQRHRRALAALQPPGGIEGEWRGEWEILRAHTVHSVRLQKLQDATRIMFTDGPAWQPTAGGREFHVLISVLDQPASPGEKWMHLYQFNRPADLDPKSPEHNRWVNTSFYQVHASWFFRNAIIGPLRPDGPAILERRLSMMGSSHLVHHEIRVEAEGDRLTLDWIGVLPKDETDPSGAIDAVGTVVFHVRAEATRVRRTAGTPLPAGVTTDPKTGRVFNHAARPVDDGGAAAAARAAEAADRKAKETGPPATEPDVRAEAIAQYGAEIGIIERNLASLRAQRADPKAGEAARREYDQQILEQEANRQGWQDLIVGLQTGQTVHSRTGWDEQAHRVFVQKVEQEVEGFAEEGRLVAGLPRLTALLPGAEGLARQEDVRAQIDAAMRSPNRLEKLRSIRESVSSQVQSALAGEQRQAGDELRWEEWKVYGAEKTQQAADLALMAGAFFVPGAGNVLMAYGMATGYIEGGPGKALENGLRSWSNKVDVCWAGVQGYYALDPETSQRRGLSGAVQDASVTWMLNKGMELAQGKTAGFRQSGGGSAKRKPVFEAFKDAGQRYDADLVSVKRSYEAKLPRASDGTVDTSHPDYPAIKQRMDGEMGRIQDKYKIVEQRRQMDQELDEIRKSFEQRIPPEARGPDGTVNVKDPRYRQIHQEWQAKMDEARARHNVGFERRWQEHEAVMRELGLTPEQLKSSGGTPETIKSDIDLTASDMRSGIEFTEAMKMRGHNVLEYPDRWVITSTDTTVWKPVRRERLGSSANDAAVALDTYYGSDKFPTVGGVHYTTKGKYGVQDARGAVISNMKKASEAGISGGGREVDYHVIGKSVDKAISVANDAAGGTVIHSPDFQKKALAVRKHRTPEEAGLVTFGNPPAAKKAESDRFLAEANRYLAQAYQMSAASSTKTDRQRAKALADAIARSDKEAAYRLRVEQIEVRVSNESALRQIAIDDPILVARVRGQGEAATGTQRSPGGDRGYGIGWLWQEIREPKEEAPAGAANPELADPTLKAAAARAGKLSSRLSQAVLPSLKGDSPEAAYLLELKGALDRCARQPGRGLMEIRAVSGYEPAQVMRDLEQQLGGLNP